MDIEAGLYYRNIMTGKVVKVLHPEVLSGHKTWIGLPPHFAHVVYRLNDDEYPHRFEYVDRGTFTRLFEGPLDWDAAVPGWEGQKA
jgi:hypothetical protein